MTKLKTVEALKNSRKMYREAIQAIQTEKSYSEYLRIAEFWKLSPSGFEIIQNLMRLEPGKLSISTFLQRQVPNIQAPAIVHTCIHDEMTYRAYCTYCRAVGFKPVTGEVYDLLSFLHDYVLTKQHLPGVID